MSILQCSSGMEPWWFAGENMGISKFNSHIHKAKRDESRLWRPCDIVIKEADSRGLLQPNSQRHVETVQVVSVSLIYVTSRVLFCEKIGDFSYAIEPAFAIHMVFIRV